MLTHVTGGTGAGSKMHRRTTGKTGWTCEHGHRNKPWAATCLTAGCRSKRPKES